MNPSMHWVIAPDSLTTIHTWAHLALATPHEVRLSQWLCKDTPTQSLKACNSSPASQNWGSLLDERKELKQVHSPPYFELLRITMTMTENLHQRDYQPGQ